jgi:hypothetical protein
MKTRHSLVSNSSSTSFMVDTRSIKDIDLKHRFWSVINGDSSHIEPDDDDHGMLLVSTGFSDGNQCLFNWWKFKKWFDDNGIKYYEQGDGTPGLEERACDFVCYITDKNDEQESSEIRVLELKHWLTTDIPNKRIDEAAEMIGITKEEIKLSISKNDNFSEIITEIIGEL